MFNGARTHPSWNGRKVNAFVVLGLALDLISLSHGDKPSYLTRRETDTDHWSFREWLSTTRLDRMAFLPPAPAEQDTDSLQLFESRVIDACVCSECTFIYTTNFKFFLKYWLGFSWLGIGVASLGPGGARAPPDFFKISIRQTSRSAVNNIRKSEIREKFCP